MTPEQRIAQLEAELVATRQVVADQARALAEHATREAAESAKREARRRVNRQNYERRKASASIRTSDSDRIQTLNQTDHPSPLNPPSLSPAPSLPSPLYPPSPHENAASPTPAVAALPTSAEGFALEVQAEGKKPRKPSAAEALFARMEDRRRQQCEKYGLQFIPTRAGWPSARINRDLGSIARAEKHDPATFERFLAAWWEFLEDDAPRHADVPLSLEWFWKGRDRYEGRALRQAGGES